MNSFDTAATLTGAILGIKAQIAGMSPEAFTEYLDNESQQFHPSQFSKIEAGAASAYALGVDVDQFIEEKEQRGKHRSITDP